MTSDTATLYDHNFVMHTEDFHVKSRVNTWANIQPTFGSSDRVRELVQEMVEEVNEYLPLIDGDTHLPLKENAVEKASHFINRLGHTNSRLPDSVTIDAMGEPIMTWDGETRSISVSITSGDLIAVGGVNEDGRMIHTTFNCPKGNTVKHIPPSLEHLIDV